MSGPDAGWLQDPDDDSRERWWDGDAWTDLKRNGATAKPRKAPRLRRRRWFAIVGWALAGLLLLAAASASVVAWDRAHQAETHYRELNTELNDLQKQTGTAEDAQAPAEGDATNG
jgi:hypothetical protein